MCLCRMTIGAMLDTLKKDKTMDSIRKSEINCINDNTR
jgi:hypothetical protein